jgi:glutamine amidotransferase
MITIVNTGVANIASVKFAFERLGRTTEVSSDPGVIQKSTHVILPGVGTASASIANLRKLKLDQLILSLSQPVLGICLGMQIMYEHSDEGDIECLGVFKGRVKKLQPESRLPIPHMGWNQVRKLRETSLLKDIPNDSHFYFVHSFRAHGGSEIVAESNYGGNIPAVIERGNWFGTQFHPERSGAVGAQVLKNFLSLS